MNTYISKILILSFNVILFSGSVMAQKSSNSLLLRDSLDFKQNKVGVNSDNNEFNPIPYKGGLLFVSNNTNT